MKSPFRLHTVTLTVLSTLPGLFTPLAMAQQSVPPVKIESVTVTANPLNRGEDDVGQPVTVVSGDALRDRESSTLGGTLGREVGVQSSAYGAGAGRPIIRGLDSARVKITESGLGVSDVSGASPDHRVSADTFNSRQVEILRGPNTLLYGSGAIGGLVNIVSDRIPRNRRDAFGGEANVRGTTAEREGLFATNLNGPLGGDGAWRIEGFKQRTRDYELAKPLIDEDGNVFADKRLPSSATDTQSASVGAALFGARGRIGAAAQRYESDYGVPNPEDPVTIQLRRSRFEAAGELQNPFAGFSELRGKLGVTDYKHTEFEPGGEPGATFSNKGYEGRIELPHPAIGGWTSVIGAQLHGLTTEGKGEGTLPKTGGTALALFAVGELRRGSMHYELGVRAERERFKVKEDVDNIRKPSRSFSLTTASGHAAWEFSRGVEVGAGLALSQRAPAVEELYFEGAHPATFAYEIGNTDLKKERSQHAELALRKTDGPVRFKLNVFENRFKDYIYGFFDGSTKDIIGEDGEVEASLSVLQYAQDDAKLRGAEAELSFGDKTGPQARLWADTVRAKLTSGVNSGQNLPRMAPSRFGGELGWKQDQWSAQLSVMRVADQKRTSGFDLRNGLPESSTQGYTLVDASVHYSMTVNGVALKWYFQGKNLGDKQAFVHTSFFKPFAPPPGRSLWAGLRVTF